MTREQQLTDLAHAAGLDRRRFDGVRYLAVRYVRGRSVAGNRTIAPDEIPDGPMVLRPLLLHQRKLIVSFEPNMGASESDSANGTGSGFGGLDRFDLGQLQVPAKVAPTTQAADAADGGAADGGAADA